MPQAFEEPLTVALKLGPRLGVVAYHKRNYEEVRSLSLSKLASTVAFRYMLVL